MKKYISVFAAVLMVLTACNKNEFPVANTPVEMTLTASIGVDTKVHVEDVDNVLKTQWEEGDKVSIVALDESYNVISNDIFEAESYGKTTNFTGTFTNDAATQYIKVFYPALTEGDGTEELNWNSPAVDSYNETGPLCELEIGKPYLNYYRGYQLQRKNNDCTHLTNYIVLSGDAGLPELKGGSWNVVLNHRSYVVKCDITFPDGALTHRLKKLTVAAYDATGTVGIQVSGNGWTEITTNESFPGGWETNYNICLGEDINAGSGTGIDILDNTFTVYMVAYAGSSWNYIIEDARPYQLTAGDYLQFRAIVFDGVNNCEYVLNRKDITNTVVLENGKMYRVSATLELAVPED